MSARTDDPCGLLGAVHHEDHGVDIMIVVAACGYLQGQPQVEQGKELLKQKKVSEAIVVLRQATQLFPRSADAWLFLAKAQMQASMPDSAEASAMKAQALDDELRELAAHFADAALNAALTSDSTVGDGRAPTLIQCS